jgi:dGTPase
MATYHNLSEEIQNRIREDRAHKKDNPYAFKDEDVVRREPDHDIANLWRPAFVRDTEKIMHCPYYARYMDKTQVFSLCKHDDVSRRATHVQYVARIARNIGAVLNLNCDLIEAIALGHDIGHTPFGHAGERKLDEILFKATGKHFNHNIHSARVLSVIFPLNLSLQTLDGIICHNGEFECKKYKPVPYNNFEIFDDKMKYSYEDSAYIKTLIPATLEGCVVRVSDIIAYLGKDRQDAIKLGLIESEKEFGSAVIGKTNAEIINNMIVNIIENSYGTDYIKMDDEYFEAFSFAKKENYQKIYLSDKIEDVYKGKIYPMFDELYDELLKQAKSGSEDTFFYKHHLKYIEEITKPYRRINNYRDESFEEMVVDYLAGMTDDYFVELHRRLFPESEYKVEYRGYFD